ncbi:MAG: DUF58 domain-containing protein [Clostridia bacterium]|nr:DUF58 domain-containing protein [Clostridia bacterium]
MNGPAINEEFLQQLETLQTIVKNNVAGLFGGNHQSKTFGSSCEFADYRDYIAGDDITKIDWNAYARFEKLYLKLYLDERQLHTRIYIDASRSMGYGKGGKDIQAIRTAAALTYLSINEMDKVSVYVIHGDKIEELFTGLLGKDAYFAAIDKFNGIVFDGDCRISDAILPSTVGYGDGLSIIISDFLTDNNFEDAIDYLAGKKRDILCVQILSAEELNPTARGKMHFFDSEATSKYYRKNINKDILAAYKAAVEYSTGRVRDFCHSREADYMLVPANESLYKVFFDKLVGEGVLK